MAEREMCGCKLSTLVKIINMALGAFMCVYGVFTIFTVIGDFGSSSPILFISFRIYQM